jgi:hypothetical protein
MTRIRTSRGHYRFWLFKGSLNHLSFRRPGKNDFWSSSSYTHSNFPARQGSQGSVADATVGKSMQQQSKLIGLKHQPSYGCEVLVDGKGIVHTVIKYPSKKEARREGARLLLAKIEGGAF